MGVIQVEIRQRDDIDGAFAAIKGHAEALFVLATPIMFVNRVHINALALAAKLPTGSHCRQRCMTRHRAPRSKGADT